MRRESRGLILLCIIALYIASALMFMPAFSGFPSRSYVGPGTGKATFYVSPQDTNKTSNKPTSTLTGTYFSVEVRLANHSHVASWQFQLIWKKALLNLTDPVKNVTKGPNYIFQGIPSTGLATSVYSYNDTHTRLLAFEATYLGVEAPDGTNNGLVVIWFMILMDPDLGQTLSTLLYFAEGTAESHRVWTMDTSAIDENNCTMLDGYYENKGIQPPQPPPQSGPSGSITPYVIIGIVVVAAVVVAAVAYLKKPKKPPP